MVDEEDSEEEQNDEPIESIAQRDAKQVNRQQKKIDKIVRNLDLDLPDKPVNMNYELDKIRKLVKITENDGFFERNDKAMMMIGTILMWISLAYASTGLNFTITQNIIAC